MPDFDWNTLLQCLFCGFFGMWTEKQVFAYVINNAQNYTEKHLIDIMKINPTIVKAIKNATKQINQKKELKEEKSFKYNEENKLREKQEIIKRNTKDSPICGLSEKGECKYVGYCKHQRKFKKYGVSGKVDILCMREGKGEQ